MTKEEAVEIVLQGDAWVICAVCNGAGISNSQEYRAAIRTRNNEAISKFVSLACAACKGWRNIVRADYAEACELVGKPVPVHTSGIEFTVFEEIVLPTTINVQAIGKLSLDS